MADRSREDRMTRLTSRDKAVKMTMKTFGLKNRPIAKLGTMAEYFRNTRGLGRAMQVQDEVGDSAYRDFMKATKSSIAVFFVAALTRDEKTTYPDMKCKSKFAPSNSIERLRRDLSKLWNYMTKLLFDFIRRFSDSAKTTGLLSTRISPRTQALKNHDSMKQRPRRRRLQGNDKHLPDAGDRVTHEY
ncbi:hypothetical protein L915_01635 [Phytophthora nicotianae]|uniref:Uncharacterized protein n=1 Tax=Phytophthora nicotianae TaxID=4792 RepID=W2HJM0_PHYNI|nr:hypothetical protein L915_01635 [Phytophthora nicotianae]